MACYSIMWEKKDRDGKEASGVLVAEWVLIDKDLDVDADSGKVMSE